MVDDLFKKHILKISIVLNIFLLLFAGGVVYQKGGAIKQKVVSVLSNKAISNPMYDKRVSLFSVLKPAPGGIVFLGDSITQYAEWDELLSNSKAINRGIGSDTTNGVVSRLDQIVKISPSKVFLMVGINDLTQGVSIQEIEKNYNVILTNLEKFKGINIYIQSVLPINTSMAANVVSDDKIIELNKRIALLAENHNVKYIDIYNIFASNGQMPDEYTVDGVHLTGIAYTLWRDKIIQYVNE